MGREGTKRWNIDRTGHVTEQAALGVLLNISRPFAIALVEQSEVWWPVELYPEDMPMTINLALLRQTGGSMWEFRPVMGHLRLPSKVQRLPVDTIGYLFRGEEDAA